MTPEMIRKAQARMRQAYTEACTNFPRMNVTPIQLAFYQTYQDVAFFVGSTYVLMDPEIGGEILAMTATAQEQLLAKKDTDRILANVSALEHRRHRGMVMGLDTSAGHTMLSMLRDGATPTQAKIVRFNMLQTRRNILANEMALKAIATAAQRFKESPRGEEVVQSMPVTATS